MTYYTGIDLHANNSVVVVLDDKDRLLYQKRRNELAPILTALEPYRPMMQGIAVESTYKWYWLVDGLMDAGYTVHLAHAPALG